MPTAAKLPDGVPVGVIELAADYLLDVGRYTDRPVPSTAALVDLLTAPLRLDRDWPEPATPFEVADGWVHVEVTDDDRPTFDAVAEQWRMLDPERFAAACQELRLPVCPYRSPAVAKAQQPPGPASDGPQLKAPRQLASPRPLEDAVVIDLSTHWAGPLSTKLLAEAGATVIKVDPDCRPDGFRQRHDLYEHLNRAKQIIDLDLRQSADRDRFESLLADADLLVESFSRRVMSNLGYSNDQLAARFPELATVAIRAFPHGSAEENWVAFGPGAHAASGLGWTAESRPQTAPVAYPDFLTGIATFAASVRLIATPPGQLEQSNDRSAEMSLAGSIAPLLAVQSLAVQAP